MQIENVMAFATQTEPPGLEIRVNFGVFAGRDATASEIDELGKLLVSTVGPVSIVAEQRHGRSEDVEIVLHQVRIEVPPERLPNEESERQALEDKLVSTAEFWARACISDRHAEISEL